MQAATASNRYSLPLPSTNNTFIIVSDSFSSLNVISQPSPSHPRLRIRHAHLTHTHLISHLMPLSYPHCNNDLPLTVDHLFECPHFTFIRDSHQVPHNRITALTDHPASLSNVFSYLCHTNFLTRI